MTELAPEVIALTKIDLDASPRVRVMLDEDLIIDYLQRRVDGAILPPIDVFWDMELAAYLVADGRHRVEAEARKGEDSILAFVHSGGPRECLEFALSANAKHGLRRSAEDIRLVVKMALEDAEWSQLSDRMLAGLCNVSHTTVRRRRTELKLEVPAGHVATSEKTSTGNKQSAQKSEHEPTKTQVEHVPPAENGEAIATKRKGADGKKYPASAAKPAAKKPKSKAPEKEPVPEAPAIDELGDPIPKPLQPIFAAAQDLETKAREIQKIVAWAESLDPNVAVWLNVQALRADLNNAKNAIRKAKPYAVCPYCRNKKSTCTGCKGCGWVNKSLYDAAPTELRK